MIVSYFYISIKASRLAICLYRVRFLQDQNHKDTKKQCGIGNRCFCKSFLKSIYSALHYEKEMQCLIFFIIIIIVIIITIIIIDMDEFVSVAKLEIC